MIQIHEQSLGDGAYGIIYQYSDVQGSTLYSVYEIPMGGGEEQLVRKSIASYEEAVRIVEFDLS